MARVFKEEDYRTKQNEILDVAQQLIYSIGYEHMTIQDILQKLQISKGAFYYYFDSKQALLEALVERMLQAAEQVIQPVVEDPALPASRKLERFFDTAARWKTARKPFFMALLRVWYNDDNAILRQKIMQCGIERVAPQLAKIIQQGHDEGLFTTPFPAQVSEVIIAMMEGLGERLARLLLTDHLDGAAQVAIERMIMVYTDSVIRVLGAPPDSLVLFDMDTMREWFASPSDQVAAKE